MSRFYNLILTVGIAAVMIAFFLLPNQAIADSSSKGGIQARIFFDRGVEKAQHNNYREAINNFTQAIEWNPKLAGAYGNRCLMYINLGNYQKAIADCSSALHLNSESIEVYLNRGLANYRIGDFQAAIADFSEVIARKPDDFRAYYNRGLARFELEDYTGAIADYDRALDFNLQIEDAALAEIYTDRGLVYLVAEKGQEALVDFSLAIALDNQNHRAYFNRGCVCHQQGRLHEAIQDYTQAVKLNSQSAEAYFNRGLVRHQLGLHQGAIADLQKASQYFGDRGDLAAYEQTLALIERWQQFIFSSAQIDVG